MLQISKHINIPVGQISTWDLPHLNTNISHLSVNIVDIMYQSAYTVYVPIYVGGLKGKAGLQLIISLEEMPLI